MALDDGGDADGGKCGISRNADLEDEDELLHRLDQYIARRDEFSSKKEKKLIRMKKTESYFRQTRASESLQSNLS